MPDLSNFKFILDDMMIVKCAIEAGHLKYYPELLWADSIDLSETAASEIDVSYSAKVITEEQKYIEMISLLHDLLKHSIETHDLENILKYSKQMQLVYEKINSFESLKKAGMDFLTNYKQFKTIRANNDKSYDLLQTVNNNNTMINSLRSELEVLSDKLIQKQMVVQQELMKQIAFKKETQKLNQELCGGLKQPSDKEQLEREQVYGELFGLIKDKVGMLKGEVEKLNEEREMFVQEIIKDQKEMQEE